MDSFISDSTTDTRLKGLERFLERDLGRRQARLGGLGSDIEDMATPKAV